MMRLNLYAECLPGQEYQRRAFLDKLSEVLDKGLITTNIVCPPEPAHLSPFYKAEAMIQTHQQITKHHTMGVIAWEGTLLSVFAHLTDHLDAENYHVKHDLSKLATMQKALLAQGITAPDVVVIPTRPSQQQYTQRTALTARVSGEHSPERWWSNGLSFLMNAQLDPQSWCGSEPIAVSVDYSDTDSAVKTLMDQLPTTLLDNYRKGGDTPLTEHERFLGLAVLRTVIPKRHLIQLEQESLAKNIRLDAHVAAILKKYLLEDILRPPTE